MTAYLPAILAVFAFLVAFLITVYLKNWNSSYIPISGTLHDVVGDVGTLKYTYGGEQFSAFIKVSSYVTNPSGPDVDFVISPANPGHPHTKLLPPITQYAPLFVFLGTFLVAVQVFSLFSSLRTIDTSVEDDLIMYSAIIEGMKKSGGAATNADYDILDETKGFLKTLGARKDITLTPSQMTLNAELECLVNNVKNGI